MSFNVNNIGQLKVFTDFAKQYSYDEDAVAHVSDVNFKGEVVGVDQNKSDGPGFFAWFRRNDKVKNANNNTRDLFMNTILKLFDVESEQSLPQEVRTAMKLKDYGKGRPLTARRIRIVKNAIIDYVDRNKSKSALDAADLRKQLGQAQTLSGIDDALLPGEENVVEGGNKENVAAFRNAHAKMANDIRSGTGESVETRRNAVLIGMTNRKICDDCKLMANGDWDMVTFNLDLKRKLEIKLPDDQRVSNDLDEARDQLAKFATGKDKYSELTEKEKTKVHVLMGILNQGVGHGLLFADGVALDPNGRSSQIFFGGKRGDAAASYKFELSREEGALKIKCSAVRPNIDNVMVFSENLTIDNLGPGSKVEVDMELKIDMDELDRLAGLDYKSYNKEQVDANYGNGNFNNCYSDLEQFGDFKLDTNKVTCTSHFKITLD